MGFGLFGQGVCQKGHQEMCDGGEGAWGKVQAGTAAKTVTDGFQSSWGTTKMRQRDIHDYFVPIQKQILN